MNILEDIVSFIKSLEFIDIFLLASVVTLLILIVTLLYFIEINKDEDLSDEILNKTITKEEKPMNKEEVINKIVEEHTEKVPEEEYNDEEGELLDLEGLTKKLQEQKDNGQVKIDKYEQEQEEKAIISYEELLSKKNNYAINYEKEEVIDDLIIKKVNLHDLVNKNVITNDTNNVRVISYEKEEDFLKTLKELNSLLN